MTDLKLLFTLLLSLLLLGCGNGQQTITPDIDTLSLLRNPAMGWGLYDDANDNVQNAQIYWEKQDEVARKYASFFYVRWRWSEMEPEEGRYAWLYDENYKQLIQGALDRGLKLAFRIYENGQDNIAQGTPDFVREAGAKGYKVKGIGGVEHWTPYVDDAVFQEKLTAFIEAFAKEYNDPSRVVFVDGYNMGWWGECHHIELSGRQTLEEVFDWVTTLYSKNFTRVITLLPFGSQIGYQTERRIAIDGKGYGMRRDGLGSMWFSDTEQQIVSERYGKNLLVGESCWWSSHDDNHRPWASDTKYKLNSWRDVYVLTCKQALDNHFNTLDLRELPEAKGWSTRAEDKVLEFVRRGGYRLAPIAVSLPKQVSRREPLIIKHSWQNFATGYMPNNHPQWGRKYRVAFALIDDEERVVKQCVDMDNDPSEWLYGKSYDYELHFTLGDIEPKRYRLAVAIVDTSTDNLPAITIATQLPKTADGWTLLTSVKIQK